MYNLILTSSNTDLSGFLTNMGTIVTQVLSWVTDVANTILSSPPLYVTMGLLLLGGAIGIFGRLLSRN